MSSIALGRSGHCYVLINGSQPGLCKIGATTLTPEERARQLTASTSSATPFFVAYSREVEDVNDAEARMHALFADRRVNRGREFFQCTVYEAVVALDRIAGGASRWINDPPTPMADLFATFPDDGGDRALNAIERAQCRALEAELTAAGTLDAHRL